MAVLNENGSSGNFVRSQAPKLCVLKNNLSLLPLSSFPLESQAFVVRTGRPLLPCTSLFHTDSFHISPALSFDFFIASSKNRKVCAITGSGCTCTTFVKVSLCSFLIRQVCQHLVECIPKCLRSHPWLKMWLWCYSYKPPYYRNRDIILSTVALKLKNISVFYYLY